MNFKILSVCIAVLLVMCLSVVRGNKEDGKHKHHQCLGVDLQFDDDARKNFAECRGKTEKKEDGSGESGEGKKEPHNHCAMDCIYRKYELITSEGKLDQDKIEAVIKKIYPKDAQDGLIADNKECMKEVTAKLTKDNDCETFQKYQHCHFKSIGKNCKTDGKKSK